jgi:hypothetical protein
MRCCDDHVLHSLTLDPHRIADFERYATTWPPIIERCGGALVGYFLPKEGPNNFALALIEFDSLAAYERYRETLRADPEARENFDRAMQTQCIKVEDRCFLRHVQARTVVTERSASDGASRSGYART